MKHLCGSRFDSSMKRTVERRVAHSLANLVASGQVKSGSIVKVAYEDSDFVFRLSKQQYFGQCGDP
jgi:hypothetical protein